MGIDLFYTEGGVPFKDAVARKLELTFGLEVRDGGRMHICEAAWSRRRSQYDAYTLLEHLVRRRKSDTALWVVDRDIFCENVNFVFGLAMYHVAAVVSTFRLHTTGMVVKEAIHEAGHVVGLQHCRNRCVMRFSNNLDDALEKPDMLCDTCRGKLGLRQARPELKI